MKTMVIALAAVMPFADCCFGQLQSGRGARLDRIAARSKPKPAPPPTPAPTPAPSGTWWQPAVGATWQIQYDGAVDAGMNVEVFDLDGFDTDASQVVAIHSGKHHAICYFSAGTYENWRPDAKQFLPALLGKGVDGWAGEKWLDVRRIDVLGPIMEARMDICKAKGFDAVDPDNVDGYSNPSGFPLSYHDQLAYNRFLSTAAHDRGMSIGLKNDLDQVADLLPSFDFQVNEQCFQYQECPVLTPFIRAGKPVFNIEYNLQTAQFCGQAVAMQFSSIRKHLSLDAFIQPCK